MMMVMMMVMVKMICDNPLRLKASLPPVGAKFRGHGIVTNAIVHDFQFQFCGNFSHQEITPKQWSIYQIFLI